LFTQAHKLRLKISYIRTIDETEVNTESVVKASDHMQKYMLVAFTMDEAASSLTGTGLPQLHFEQLQVICGHNSISFNAIIHKA